MEKEILKEEREEILPPVEIPASALSPEALNGLIESFIMREGTDYGLSEVSHETKVAQVRKQIEKGDVKIIFDLHTDTATLLTDRDWKKASAFFNQKSQ